MNDEVRATVIEVTPDGYFVITDEGSDTQIVDRLVFVEMVRLHNESLDKLNDWKEIAYGLLWRDWHFVHCNDKNADTCKWCQAAAKMGSIEEL